MVLLLAPGASGRVLADTWSGTWSTEWGALTLAQSGSRVEGTYEHDQGHIVGTTSGGKFKGRWDELPTRKGPNDAGAVEFSAAGNGKSFTGRWNYDGSPTSWHTDWNGRCIGGRCLQNTTVPTGGGGTTTPGGSVGSLPPPTATATGAVLVGGKPFTSGTIPYNSTVDVTNGRLVLQIPAGRLTVSGRGVSASFKLLRGLDGKNAIVELRLTKGDFSACPKRKTSGSARATAKTVRQLWGDGKGKFRTRGRYAAATVRGTLWLTADRCDGTYVKVNRGVVAVSDLGKRKQVTVRAGRSYLAAR
jgi:hypothetical protein